MDIFVCDIIGTFKGIKENNGENVKDFIQKILTIVEMDKVDYIVFSFISSENMDVVKSCINEIKPYLNDKIKLGIQFSEYEIYYEGLISETNIIGKLEQIVYITNKFENIQNIYFADDGEVMQVIVSNFFEKKHPEFNLVNFVPGTDSKAFLYSYDEFGLTGLNKIMDQYIHDKKIKTKTIIKKF